MKIIVVFTGIFFTIFSSAILAYTSIATIMGPWIAPTIVLLSLLMSKILTQLNLKSFTTKDIIVIQGIAAGGGIIATGLGFALPMIYFLDPATFSKWMTSPVYFLGLIAAICVASGAFGLCIGRILSKTFVDKEMLPFPVSQLTYKIATTDQHKQAKSLFGGVVSTLSFLVLRDGIGSWTGIFPKVIYLFPNFLYQEFAISFMPMFWAIGCTMGMPVIIPLLIGMASKYLILFPLNYHSILMPFCLFKPYDHVVFAFAFCSGILVYEIFHALPRPWHISNKLTALRSWLMPRLEKLLMLFNKKEVERLLDAPKLNLIAKIIIFAEPAITLSLSFIVLSYFKFSLLAQVALLSFTAIATYQICLISGEIGLLQLGRFAMLVMVPMYFLFKLNFVQITMSCVFFNICAATASDFLFDRKTGTYCGISKAQTYKYQILGLLVAASCLGLFMWLLFTNLQLGSPELFAQRAQAKAVLIQAIKFDPFVVMAGFLFAFVLRSFKISPAMVFGGIVMPNKILLSLLLGAAVSSVLKNNEQLQFFSAGVFSSESLWIFACIAGKLWG